LSNRLCNSFRNHPYSFQDMFLMEIVRVLPACLREVLATTTRTFSFMVAFRDMVKFSQK
jgi:hypothetical protein